MKLPDGTTQAVAVQEGRAVLLGERAGILRAGGPAFRFTHGCRGFGPRDDFVCRELARRRRERDRTGREQLVVDGKIAGSVFGFRVGVRRDIWVYFSSSRRCVDNARVGDLPPASDRMNRAASGIAMGALRLARAPSGSGRT
jgi:hypothetical protein